MRPQDSKASHTVPVGAPQPPGATVSHGHGGPEERSQLQRAWPVTRYLVGIGGVAIAVWVLSSHTDELSGITAVFDHVNWWWILGAVGAEALSFLSFTAMEYQLLSAGGGFTPPVSPLFRMTLASQALTNSLPAGNVVSTVYGFRWFRRFGADETLAVWAMVGTVIASMVSLSLVATVGLTLATEEGASLDLVPVLFGVLVVTIAVGVLFVYERPLLVVLPWVLRASQLILRRPRGDITDLADRIVRQLTAVKLGWRQVITIVGCGMANWLFDCACFALMFLAIGASIPSKGLLLAYGAGQLAAVLPITPGGLGVVEGSITIALVAFGGAHVTTVDAVLLYRLVSFWLVLVVGWLLVGELALEVRTGRWSRRAFASPVHAAIEARTGSDSLQAVPADGPSAS